MTTAPNHNRLLDREEEARDGRPGVFLMTNTLETGGSERQFALLVEGLRERGLRIEIGCMRRTASSFLKESEGLHEFSPGGSFFGLQAQRVRLELARYLRRRKIAIAHAFDFYSNLMLIPTARLARVPVVVGSQRQMGDLLTRWQFRVQNAAFRLVDRVIANSWAAADCLCEAGLPQARVTVITNALASEHFQPAIPALRREPGVLRVGMIARMNTPAKNHRALLRAAARLVPRFPALEFVLVGDGPLRPALESMVQQLCLDDRVRFLGERMDVTSILASLDVTVLPSTSESLSNAILESMAAGVPVVATRVGGNPEVVCQGETGLLVPPEDDDKLVEALERLLVHPEFRQELGQRARTFACANFSRERVMDNYEQLYAGLLREKGLETLRLSLARRTAN